MTVFQRLLQYTTDHYFVALKVDAPLGTLFIDTQYLIFKSKNHTSEMETEMFENNTQKLWAFANSSEPFSCKDIEIALSDLVEEKKQTKDLTEKLQNKVTELNATESNRSQLETDLEREKNKYEETLKQKEDNLNQTNTDLKTEKAKTQNLEEQVTNLSKINEDSTTELANSTKELNEIKNKLSDAETKIKRLEKELQGLNGNVGNMTTVAVNTVTKVIWAVEFSSRGYKIGNIFA